MRPLILATLTALALAPSAGAASLTPYGNPRFGFWVDVPASLRRLPPPDNGDGQAWRTLSGKVNLSAWGSFAPGVYGETSVQATFNREKKTVLQDGARLTYTHLAADGFTLSGFLGSGEIFYQRSRLRNGVQITVLVTYPPSEAATWNKLVGPVAASLRWGR
ncbi:hypothetical protein ACFFLM_25215 [Deinococcus oregonensis]|uniref:Uncharacterized protein n=1 Tax=Deinococcus oregonensis TaxID=1805970 RepID=A0ABV6B667_9DEIO